MTFTSHACSGLTQVQGQTSENRHMVERLLGTPDRNDGVGQVQLANTLVDTVDEDGIWELRLSWCAVSQETADAAGND